MKASEANALSPSCFVSIQPGGMWPLRGVGVSPWLLFCCVKAARVMCGGSGAGNGKAGAAVTVKGVCRVGSNDGGANSSGSWSAPCWGASWGACSGNVASGTVLSAFPGLRANPAPAGAAPRPPRVFFGPLNDLGGPWSTGNPSRFPKGVVWSLRKWLKVEKGRVSTQRFKPSPLRFCQAFSILEL